MRKRFITYLHRGAAVLTAVVLGAAVLAPVHAAAADADSTAKTFDDGILTYTVLGDSMNVAITACENSASYVNILPTIDGYTITAIAEGAFAGCSSMQTLTFPVGGSITEIGAYAFAECTSLRSVTLPDTITTLPQGAFAYCFGLESVELGDGITEIGQEAFSNCTALQSIKLPASLEYLDGAAFYMCSSLESVEIPESLASMGAYTFLGCTSLKSFHVPATLEDLGSGPFLGCMSLENLTVDEQHPNYAVKDGILFSKDYTVLYFYPPCKTDTSYTVPQSIVDVFDGAFFQCTNLQSVVLPEGLNVIGSGAFDYCEGLTSVVIPESVTQIMSTAFADCTSLREVTFVGADREDGGMGADLTIGDHAFYTCDSLHEVLLPKRVTSVGSFAFGCKDLVDDGGNSTEVAEENFLLRGYDAAEQYARDCSLKVPFQHMEFPWKTVLLWVLGGAVLVVIIFFALRIVRRNMMTPEEKEALREAKREQKLAASMPETADSNAADEAYESILGDAAQQPEAPESSGSPLDFLTVPETDLSVLHHTGHAAADAAEEFDADAVILPTRRSEN